MKIDKKLVLVGSDFEMFLQDETGKLISAIPFNSGTKRSPEKLERDGCCIQRDGTLQECNVPPVGLDAWKDFYDNVLYVKGYITGKVEKDGLELLCCPSGEFEDDQLTLDEAKRFGCDPDYLAWEDGRVNEKQRDETTRLRSCGGHVHLSFPEASPDNCIALMKLFDLYLTLPFVLLDEDVRRRELYGRAGSMRMCQWGDTKGFEARTLSNLWIDRDEYTEYVFHQLNLMFDHYNESETKLVDKIGYDLQQAINNSDKTLAERICNDFNIYFPTLIEDTSYFGIW